MTETLFSPYQFKSLQLHNRVVMAPMCQYSVTAKDGIPNDWHQVHYVSRAVGGTGLIIIEMTDVEPDERITDQDLGIWSDDHIPAFAKLVDGMHAHGSKVAIQIAHAGRKAQDAVQPVASSVVTFPGEAYKEPRALTTEEVGAMVQKFAAGVRRAVQAGVDAIELHGAHGYLIHQFHSPLMNHREDVYGQELSRFGVEVIHAVKKEMPADMPLLLRISAVEYADGGYDIDHTLKIARAYQEAGVDMFHISSGGEGPAGQRKPGNYPGYQVPFARRFREELQVPVIAVGMLEDAALAQAVIGNEDADLVAIGRGMLRDPYWANHAALELGVTKEKAAIAEQYSRGY
ncbi:NADH:flavin oxidoreductase/NADH oxidase [Paenibacillus barcinonensis]|uniref:2,4-dienoyl-CoA reductase-like NADH-dependent reductase (Old Yellow Enzyme family) n=1 Tax=Paenibacillus barcinonensis TaxID=198119 RepID=A0A2V4VPK7_PAEBA|nr:NADH:flavin oxidoreductase/NADH oxidase [Paenibacillus barcinonensis]PYE44258.1 2,4-dienoyl-CoA reductase-like NADH-dependent reductase (Old Yellow Enzyme family) [Paenibacillus barcinonensis]QKS57633.1 NADH:flavin oxidoreductase/NADH oxidase [Paenibacillus barcinonensis]